MITKVSVAIERELRHCDAFYISVAFITEGGLAPLKQGRYLLNYAIKVYRERY